MTETDREEDLQIDEFALEKEWVRQPKLRYKYGVELADARNELDKARVEVAVQKAELEKTAAKLHRVISADPDDYGLTKTTEAAVGGAAKQHPSYAAQEEKLQDAKRSEIDAAWFVNVLEAVVSAVDHRKKGLEKLVDLYLADYYAKPRAPRGREEEVDQMEKDQTRRRQARKRRS